MTATRAAALADAVAAYVGALVNLNELATDPFGMLEGLGLDVAVIDPADLPPGCSIAATYDRDARPPSIRVSNDLSAGRRNFSVLHEYAHHVRDNVTELVDALWEQTADAGAELEERVCDAFAARVLLPPDVVAEHLGTGVTAAAVMELIGTGRASREACAVAAAQRLPSAGHVMLLDSDGFAVFTATAGMLPRVARSTPQDGVAVLRGVAGTARGRDRVRLASGVHSGELLVDVARSGGWTVAVWVEHSPPWGGLSIALDNRPVGVPGYCEDCAKEFLSFAALCRRCGEPRCGDCGACACPAAASPGERECPDCHMLLPSGAFAAGSVCCRDCA
ncbi:MAG: ImmA/IrrE family metallo-endopeptidase [Jatrophihabitantaceae bacterium]